MPAKRKPKPKKFHKGMYVLAYRYAKDGASDEQVAKSLGVSGPTFRRWCADDEWLEDALEQARDTRQQGTANTFGEYVYQHLSPDLQELWDEINECAELENGVERVEALLRNGGKHARQHLFIHALATTCFNVTKAMRMLNVSRKSYDNWRKHDHQFAELLDEMDFHKDNFFETAFIGRVSAGDTAAILHAVRSKLGHRGYNDKLQIEHSGTVEHRHTVDVTELGLSLKTRKEILTAMRSRAIEAEALPA